LTSDVAIQMPKIYTEPKGLILKLKTWSKHVSYYGFVLSQKFNNV